MEEVLSDGRYSGVITNHQANFLRCSKNLTDPAYTRVSCLSGNAGQVFVNITDDVLFSNEIPESCVKVSEVPTIYDSSKKNLSYEVISMMLEEGFDLGWTVDCRNCKLSNGFCNLRSEKKPYSYSCSYAYGDYTPAWLFFFNPITVLRDLLRLTREIGLPLVIVVFLIHNCITTRKKIKKMEISMQSQQVLNPKRYSYNDIVLMTSNLRDKLGQGAFGSVFRGQLPNGCLIAVKLLGTLKVSEENFINEVARICSIRHPNLVQLVGFCSEGSKRALLYEYVPNGSLENHVFSKIGKAEELGLEQLQEIAFGTAKGIEFLHKENEETVLHLDIKPQNVLLDQNFTPKVADFGLIKFYPKKSDFLLMISAREKFRYMAPEMVSSDYGDVSRKSDVFSFGILLLEMATGRRNVETDSNKAFFPTRAYDQLNKGGDVEIETVINNEGVIAKKMLIIGLWCTQVKAVDRPSMSRVVELLQGKTDDLKMPPRPFLSSPEQMSTREARFDSPKERLIAESMERSL